MIWQRRIQRLLAISLVLVTNPLFAQSGQSDSAGSEDAVMPHIMALEQSGNDDLDVVLEKFDAEHFSQTYLAATTREERRTLLAKISAVAKQAGGVMLNRIGDEIMLELAGPQSLAVFLKVQSAAPYRIDALRVEEGGAEAPPLAISWESVGSVFDDLEQQGFAGTVHVSREGRTLLHRAYGKSNRELDYDTQLDTIYGIGSTPIAFTVAGIYLLAQQNKLALDAPISNWLGGVPEDKKTMTVGQLITGESGLPDFHDEPGDWDRDLAWIDRETAVTRILAQRLVFAPGTGKQHSHSAYGLAAAIIEIVSGQDYFAILTEHFLQPAGMTRTGMYGDAGGMRIRDFAVGYGPSSVGVPNIPPNWGPTSWLVLGSGGMYSTLGDMLKFYEYVRADKIFEPRFAKRFLGQGLGIAGSDRGFYFFYAHRGRDAEVMLLMNGEGRTPEIMALSRGLEQMVMGEE